MIERYKSEIEKTIEEGVYRQLYRHGDSFIDFSSNDYLNLSNDIGIINAGYEAAKRCGAGSTGSRLLSGNKFIFEEFENEIACDKNTEKALIFNSGYQANLGILSTLLNKDSIA
ncbi:MAG: aminotransferase class I/II-fold pyridoxal phosphate-dependent enzyme, partial [Holosporales bacterium]|nr:aminotransferase class I/II-fold pyridoxal phosphate-dependent enzyme [Holosporales bacterium]